MYTKQQRIAELARREPQVVFTSLNHYLDLNWLSEAYRRLNKQSASGDEGRAVIVLDASVVLKWFIEEDDQARAAKWRDANIAGDQIVAVPEILYYEVANVMAIAQRMTPEDANIVFSLLWTMDLERFDFGRDESSMP